MKIRKITLYILCAIVMFVSCNKDDGGLDVTEVPIRDRTEQQVVDKDSLIGYLETHYYNSGDFVSNTNPSINDLIISELPSDGVLPDPANNTLLIDAIEVKNTSLADIDYEYYILRLNQGGGVDKPNFPDNIRVNFSGNLLDEVVFDSSANPIDFDLTNLVPGWGRTLPQFNVAESFIENGDGTIGFTNAGVGVMFLPSGLAFYSDSPPSVPLYSNVIFRFELYQSEINDHDLDGVPSYLEDVDGDFNLGNDDTDEDGAQDFIDGDDDNDGTLTVEEDLEDIDPNVDSSGDGNLTNDLDGDGDPTNDDTDGDGIPNYLDTDDTVSNKDDDN